MPDPRKAAQLADAMRDNLAVWIQHDFPGKFISVFQVTFNTTMTEATVWTRSEIEPDTGWLNILTSKEGWYHHRLCQALKRRSIPRLKFRTAPEELPSTSELSSLL
jgi:ribosome-binding factor A